MAANPTRRDFVGYLGAQGTWRPGPAVDAADHVIWATAGADFFPLLITERGRSHVAYETGLADTWPRRFPQRERS